MADYVYGKILLNHGAKVSSSSECRYSMTADKPLLSYFFSLNRSLISYIILTEL